MEESLTQNRRADERAETVMHKAGFIVVEGYAGLSLTVPFVVPPRARMAELGRASRAATTAAGGTAPGRVAGGEGAAAEAVHGGGTPRGLNLFATPLQNQFAEWAFEYVDVGADVGEIVAIANDMRSDDDSAYYDAWYGHATRHRAAADEAEKAGKKATARYHHLRATVYASVSYKPIFGYPVDPRLKAAFQTQMTSFEKAMALDVVPAERLDVSLDGHRLEVFFLRAADAGPGERRPVILMNNGYDASVSDMYFAMGRQSVGRGYHAVLIDGPGQGALLIRDNQPLIPDWERVVRAVVDVVVTRRDVDTERIVLQGWSLGGHLALRAATGEPRLAAVVSDPPAWSILASIRPAATALGLSAEAISRLPEISDADAAAAEEAINANPRVRWTIVQRSYWANGATDFKDWLRVVAKFDLTGLSEQITCPVLGTFADRDPLALNATETISRLTARTTLLTFTAAEGAGGHQEMLNRALAETRILDWLDHTLR
jgi:pimeloyl-ACP methyl ester carboxylesterase